MDEIFHENIAKCIKNMRIITVITVIRLEERKFIVLFFYLLQIAHNIII